MVIATAGAMAHHEYFDAVLLVALFILAELIEKVVMIHVRKAIKVRRKMSLRDISALIVAQSS
jgi:hypothetical protein